MRIRTGICVECRDKRASGRLQSRVSGGRQTQVLRMVYNSNARIEPREALDHLSRVVP